VCCKKQIRGSLPLGLVTEKRREGKPSPGLVAKTSHIHTHPDLVRWRRPRGLLRWRQRHRGAVYHCMRPSSSMWCARPGELEIRSRPTRCPRALHDRVRALRHVDRCTRSACARSMRARVIPPERARRIKLPRARALLLRHATHRSTRCFAMRGLSLRTLPISFFPCAVAGWQAG
jgi:hypothetical protein